MENKKHMYYKVNLKEFGSSFSLYENRVLKKGDYHLAPSYEMPIYTLTQKGEKRLVNGKQAEQIHYHLEKQMIQVCNSFREDGFFYDKEQELVFYSNVFIYAIEKEGRYFDLVTGQCIPICTIHSLERVMTSLDHITLKQNLNAINPHVVVYQRQFESILNHVKTNILNEKRNREDLQKGKEVDAIEPKLVETPPQNYLDYKKFVESSTLKENVDSLVSEIKQKIKKIS